jgi:YVTN family beta-propeller protein
LIKKHAVSYTLILTLSVVVVAVSSTFLGLESAWADSVIKTIPVERPAGVAFNPSNNDMYVANFGGSTVSVIDSSTNTVVDTIVVGPGPHSFAFNPSNNDMYVTISTSNTVSVIDSSTNEVVDTIPVGAFPLGIAFNPRNNDMYVANRDSNTVSVIATTTPTPTPQQAIQNLIDIIDSISKGITTSLESTLNAVIRQLNHNNDEAACNQLNAFLNKVDTRENNGRLTPQQAADLRQQATAIQDALGCSSSSPSSLLPPSSSLQSQRHQQQSPDTNLPSTLSISP